MLSDRAASVGKCVEDKKEHNIAGNIAYYAELLIWSERAELFA